MAYNLEEQESIDNLKNWWDRWGTLIMVGVTAVCLAVAGYNGYRWYKHRQTAQASTAYAALQAALASKDDKNISSLSDGLIDKYGSTVFGPMAAFASAAYAAANGDAATAKARLQWVVDHGGRAEFEAVARVRLAGLLLDEGSADKALSVLTAFKPASDAEKVIVGDRLGDVYLTLGRTDDARRAWNEAFELARDGDPMKGLLEIKTGSLPETQTAASAAASSAAAG